MRWLLLLLVLLSGSAWACELIMGYRTTQRPPFIAGAPDNTGLYKELYETAAAKMGCQLTIIRSSKSRILAKLESGDIDFYPGLTPTSERAQYVHFFPNGLVDGYMGISHLDLADITHHAQLSGKTLLIAKGGPKLVSDDLDVIIKQPPELSVAMAAEMIDQQKADFYMYNFTSLIEFMKHNKHLNIKLHRQCCGEFQPMQLGFSLKSELIKTTPNNQLRVRYPYNNQQLEGESKALQLKKALAEMKQDGTTAGIFYKHFNYPMPRLTPNNQQVD
ncbi:substrate-binding periplasmic protein [Motilimonas eburnea]|uniref:substrate-binding periplasmic protein n=1 Tax=Motilimonas eburnea TaxID=1737488 RepID=UPI001E3C99BD|nr:transporter substrate-binding domain-containing protein [Motilimonas eburnea]MCE2571319.1 transporter substrate-binding domain-containing protein [Motilimonas eburnea]